MLIIRKRLLVIAAMTIVVACVAQFGHGGPPRPTGDLVGDAIERLLRLGRFEDARWLCRRSLRGDPTEDAYAKSLSRLARVEVAEALDSSDATSDSVEAAMAPLIEFLDRYPDHRRRLFLRSVWLDLRFDQLRSQTAQATLRGTDDEALRRDIIALKDDRSSLADSVHSRWVEMSVEPTSNILVAELRRLENAQRAKLVETLLLQIELPGDERERVAAAADVARTAESALESLPVGSPARAEVQFLYALSLFRGGQSGESAEALKKVAAEFRGPRWTALEIELADDPASKLAAWDRRGIDALPVELARLRVRLRGGDVDAALVQYERIGDRFGVAASRRAEAIMLAMNRSGVTEVSASNDPAADTSSVQMTEMAASQAVRAGDNAKATRLFTAAAIAAEQSQDAIRNATAAASLMRQTDPIKAAKLLIDTAGRFAPDTHAASIHYAAIHLVAGVDANLGSSDANPNVMIRDWLDEHQQRFPDSPHAEQVSRWLVGIWDAADQPVQAAVASIGDDANERWFKLYRNRSASLNDQVDLDKAIIRWVVRGGDRSQARRVSLAASLVDADWLGPLGEATTSGSDVMRFRLGSDSAGNAIEPDPKLAWRLVQDALRDEAQRQRVAELMSGWTIDDPVTRIGLNIIRGKEREALLLAKEQIAEDASLGDRITIARTLAQGDSDATRFAAAQYDVLASGVSKSDPSYYEFKWLAIEALQRHHRDDAIRRARFMKQTAKPPEEIAERLDRLLSNESR